MKRLMPRGLDHVVHAVRDLDAAAELYRRLGFTVGARNRHSWGTHNNLVQLPGFFVELLAMADTSAITPHGERFFSYRRDGQCGRMAALVWLEGARGGTANVRATIRQ